MLLITAVYCITKDDSTSPFQQASRHYEYQPLKNKVADPWFRMSLPDERTAQSRNQCLLLILFNMYIKTKKEPSVNLLCIQTVVFIVSLGRPFSPLF